MPPSFASWSSFMPRASTGAPRPRPCLLLVCADRSQQGHLPLLLSSSFLFFFFSPSCYLPVSLLPRTGAPSVATIAGGWAPEAQIRVSGRQASPAPLPALLRRSAPPCPDESPPSRGHLSSFGRKQAAACRSASFAGCATTLLRSSPPPQDPARPCVPSLLLPESP